MSYRIAICDDSRPDALFVLEQIKSWASVRHISVWAEIFESAEQFMFRYASDKAWDILLLDIEMGAMDGVTMAKKIRQKHDSVQIVFITGFPDYIQEGYEVSALHYLLKPINTDKLCAVLDRAVTILGKQEQTLLLPVDGQTVRVPVSKILYVEAFAHSIAVALEDRTLHVKLSITQMEQMLAKGFARCHRSYLVGLRYISRISKTEVILDNGKCLPISRTAAPLVHKRFISYYTGENYETV